MYDNPEIQKCHIKCAKVCSKFSGGFFSCTPRGREREVEFLNSVYSRTTIPQKNIVEGAWKSCAKGANRRRTSKLLNYANSGLQKSIHSLIDKCLTLRPKLCLELPFKGEKFTRVIQFEKGSGEITFHFISKYNLLLF